MKIQRIGLVIRVAVIFLLSSIVSAQSGGTFVIEKSVIASGGGNSSGGTFLLDGTIGQSFAGTTSSGGVFSLGSGFWAGSAAAVAISGTVTYGNAMGSPAPPRFVSNVTLTGAGSPTVTATTGPLGATAGQYALSGFGSGSYTVTPSKTGGVNGAISSFDAGRIALHVAGPPNPQLTATQLMVADVSNNGAVTSFDAGMIAKFVAGPPYIAPGIGLAGTWRFSPVNQTYATVTTNVTGQDYTALLMGEVSGNWANTGARPMDSPLTVGEGNFGSMAANGGQPDIVVSLPKIVTHAEKEIIIPVTVQGLANKGVIAYEFDLRYDPSVIRPLLNAVDIAGTISRSLTPVINASEPGLLRVVMYGPMALTGNGILLNLKFTAVGTPGSTSPLRWDRIIFNEGVPQIVPVEGRIDLTE
jgi:hypothetical protein